MRGRLFLIASLAALLLVTPAVVQAVPTTPDASLESRGPIRVTSDLDLTLPHHRSANGVRGGTGTPGDPVVISGWRIESDGKRAIHITNTTLSVVVRDVVVSGEGEAREAAIHLDGARNVTLERVRVPEWEGGAMYAEDVATLRLHTVTIEGGGGSDFSAIRILRVRDARLDGIRVANRTNNGVTLEFSTARIAHSTFEGFPDSIALAGGGSKVTVEACRWMDTKHAIAHYRDAGYRVRNSTFENVTYGVRLTASDPLQGAGPRLIVAGNTFNRPGAADWWPTGVHLQPTLGGSFRIANNTFSGFGTGVRLFEDLHPPSANQTVRIALEGNRFEGNGDGVAEGQTALQDVDVTARNNVFRNNRAGYWQDVSDADFLGNAFVANTRGIVLSGGTAQAHTLEGNDFVANRDYAVMATNPVDAPRNWWGHTDGPTTEWGDHVLGARGDRVTANVRFDPFLQAPAVLSEAEVAGVDTTLMERARPGFDRATTPGAGPALAVAAVALALVLGGGARRLTPRTPP